MSQSHVARSEDDGLRQDRKIFQQKNTFDRGNFERRRRSIRDHIENHIYIGEEYDPSTNYNYLNARYTDSTRGQFLSQDPVFWEVGETKDGQAVLTNPQALNSYLYANGNPVGNKDPSGRCVGFLAVACIYVAPYVAVGLEAAGVAATTYYTGKTAYTVGKAYLSNSSQAEKDQVYQGALFDLGAAMSVQMGVGSGVFRGSAGQAKNLLPEGKMANHVFSGKPGKFIDTIENRKLIESVANKTDNYVGVDSHGKGWYAEINQKGQQVYVYSQNGVVKGAGTNNIPRDLKKDLNLK